MKMLNTKAIAKYPPISPCFINFPLFSITVNVGDQRRQYGVRWIDLFGTYSVSPATIAVMMECLAPMALSVYTPDFLSYQS